jgi:hypothetical protein
MPNKRCVRTRAVIQIPAISRSCSLNSLRREQLRLFWRLVVQALASWRDCPHDAERVVTAFIAYVRENGRAFAS